MMKRKLIAGFLGLSILATPMTAWARGPILIMPRPEPIVQSEVEIMNNVQMTFGTISKITNENGDMHLSVETANGTIVYNCSAETWIADSNGLPMNLNERITDEVLVYHAPMMTFSLPPQSPAIAIIGNMDAASHMFYAVVENIIKNNDGTITLVTDNGSRYITLTKDTQVTPFKTRNIITAQDITIGSQLLLSYEILTLSEPAQGVADKAVVLNIAQNDRNTTDEEVKMLPLRVNAETLGYDVQWNDGQIILTKGENVVKMSIGEATIEQNGLIVSVAKAAEVKDSVSYVAKEVIEMLAE